MEMEERIRRINELYHKSQTQGLTEEEKAEQAALRREYVENIRGNLKAQLDSIRVERPDGTVERLKASVAAEKAALRKQVLARRAALSGEERERACLLMTERILGHQWFYRSEILLGFVSHGSEIDTQPLLEEALRLGKRVYVPRVEGDGMEFYRIASLEELSEGYRGIREPSGSTERFDYEECRRRRDTERTLLLMPGVAFDPHRNRLGFGRGFYDRYLAERKELLLRSIAVGFCCQMVEQVPAQECDQKPGQVILV